MIMDKLVLTEYVLFSLKTQNVKHTELKIAQLTNGIHMVVLIVILLNNVINV